MSRSVRCPQCGGTMVRQITPREYECVTPHPAGLVPPEAQAFPPMRPCGWHFEVFTTTRSAACACGRESIGRCVDCGSPLCGLHITGQDEALCESCREKRLGREQVSREEASREHARGRVRFDLGSASSKQGNWLLLRDVWIAVFNALKTKEPPADFHILDERRLDELPSRWPPRKGWFQQRRLAQWNAAVDGLGVPAWATKASLREGVGVADTFSIAQQPLCVGRNGILYSNPSRPTPNGTYAEWRASYRSADEVPGGWSAKWLPYGTYHPRQEVADALANLVTIHGLQVRL